MAWLMLAISIFFEISGTVAPANRVRRARDRRDCGRQELWRSKKEPRGGGVLLLRRQSA
jgi:hypothetical protein